jgi:uncharacterized protein YcbK (DUF882 family)
MVLPERDTTDTRVYSRRAALGVLAGAAIGSLLPARAAAAGSTSRTLALWHTHTRERLEVAFADAGGYRPAGLVRVNSFLRDFRTDEVHTIDPALLDLLHRLSGELQAVEPFHVISGYRSPRTNLTLRARSSAVARYSLHMEGKAIDIRLPDVRLTRLRDAALALKAGGVGYYPGSDFVHVDTGRVRAW